MALLAALMVGVVSCPSAIAAVAPTWGEEASEEGTTPPRPIEEVEEQATGAEHETTGAFDRENRLDFGKIITGDVIVSVNGKFSITNSGHAGLQNKARYTNLDSACVLSANKTPRWTVQYETARKYRGYDRAFGMRVAVPESAHRYSARDFCVNQLGEPYNIFSSKSDLTRWYCSKLAWAAYYYNFNERRDGHDKDIDYNSGPTVWPYDIVRDNDTWCIEYSD